MQKLFIRVAFILSLIIVSLFVIGEIFFWTYTSFFPENPIPDYSKNDGRISIVATIYPLAWLASDLDPVADITTLVGPGLEPHDFSPTINDVKKIHDAELLIVNGGVDSWIDDASLERNFPTISVLEMLDYPSSDPHVWLDPILMIRVVEEIGHQLEQYDPARADIIHENVQKKQAVLEDIDREYRTGLASCQIREIVSSHDAFGFLAKRYGFSVESVAGFSPEDEPSASRLVELTNLIRSHHVTTVFFEELVSPALAQTLANETGVKTDVLDAIESLASEEKARMEYPGIMESNLAKLRTAMICE